MKYIKILIVFTILLSTITSCEVTAPQVKAKSFKWVAPKYTNVEKIIKIQAGMSIIEVERTLGIEPFDVYTIQDKEVSIFSYHYRLKDRSLDLAGNYLQQEITKRGTEGSQTGGKLWYGNTHKLLYVYYKNGQMVSLLTESGDKDAVFLLLTNNHMKKIANTGNYTNNSDTTVVKMNN